ncbi:hypothetical protein F4X86_01615 [Candidatus Saccharibacteria bacterium]|nr:hypothetical protein [Candidatus Saccharibacteria bacterium]
MKKKGIAELEFIPYLQDLLQERYEDNSVVVKKSGGDALLWFGRTSKQVTREPDYVAQLPDGTQQLYEFQIAEDSDINYFDFKVSKVGKKIRGKDERRPHLDREFFYILRDRGEYAFFTPKWVLRNGRYGFVQAWRVSAYRVPRGKFLKQFKSGGGKLERVIDIVKDKRTLLEFQEEFMDKEVTRLARKFQQVVDDKKLVEVVPNSLKGFYEICFLLDRIGRGPSAPSVWLVYLTSFYRDDMTRLEFARFMYALDFVYFKCLQLTRNEVAACSKALESALRYVRRQASGSNGSFRASPRESAVEATRRMVFGVNLLEDLIQDAIVEYGMPLKPIESIFQTIRDPRATAGYIRRAAS